MSRDIRVYVGCHLEKFHIKNNSKNKGDDAR